MCESDPSDSGRSVTRGSYAGYSYEIKLMILFLLRGQSKTDSFFLRTNVDKIGAFDDVVVRYKYEDENGQQKSKLVFLQAKHKMKPNNDKITMEKLKKEKGPFSLSTYFKSYLKIKDRFCPRSSDSVFQGKFTELDCEFAIYTNAVLDDGFEPGRTVDAKSNGLLGTNEDGKIVKFTLNDDMNFLTNFAREYHIRALAQKLNEFVFGRAKYQNMMKDEILKEHHVFLAGNVLDVHRDVSSGKSGKFRTGTFKEDFFKTNDWGLRLFRESLYSCKEVQKLFTRDTNLELNEGVVDLLANLLHGSNEIDLRIITEESLRSISKLVGSVLILDEEKRLRFATNTSVSGEVQAFLNDLELVLQSNLENYTFINVNEIIRFKFPEDIKLPINFGDVDPTLKNVEKFAKRIVNLLEMSQSDRIIKIDGNMIDRKVLREENIKDVKKLVGHLLVLSNDTDDKGNEILKFSFDNLSEDAKKLIVKMKEEIGNKKLSKCNLEDYRFSINVKGFPKLQMSKSHGQVVPEFLGKLRLYTNQANETKVSAIIKEEISQYHNGLSQRDVEFIFSYVLQKVEAFWKSEAKTDSSSLKYQITGGSYFEEAVLCLYENYLDDLAASLHKTETALHGITFCDDKMSELKSLIDSKQVVNIIVNRGAMLLSHAKLHQLSEHPECNKTYIFFNLDMMHKYQDTESKVIEILKSKRNILVIESQSAEDSEHLYQQLFDLMQSNPNKKVVLITPEKSKLSARFQEGFHGKYVGKYEESHFIDLAEESRVEILKKMVMFQKKWISLKELMDVEKDVSECTDEELNCLDKVINPKALHELIFNDRIEIGTKQPDLSDLEPIYYVTSERIEKEQFLKSYMDSTDLFVISGTTQDEFLQFIPELNSEEHDENRYVILTSKDGDRNLIDFKQVCSDHPQHIVHLIEKEGEQLTWKRSYNTTFYIPSKLYYVVINKNALIRYNNQREQRRTDVFAISGDQAFDFAGKDHIIGLNDESEETFENTCSAYSLEEHNIHWLENKTWGNRNELVWKKTKGQVDNIRKLRDGNSKFTVCENDLHRIINHEKNVVISSIPGIGKTTMLTDLFGQPSEPHWVIQISFSNERVQELLKKINPKDLSSVVEFFSQLDVGVKGSLSKRLLEHRISQQGQVVLLLDGVDEIKSQSQDMVIELLNFLKNTEAKVRVTTRPHVKDTLESTLCSFAYSVKAFSKENQQELLRKFWKASFCLTLHNVTHEVMNETADKLFEHFNRNINDRYEFMSTPLLTRVFAEVNQDVVKKFCNPDNGPHFLETGNELSVLDLYEKFVERKYDIYFKEKMKMKNDPYIKGNVSKALNKDHQRLSFCKLFSELEHVTVLIDNRKLDQEWVINALKLVGIVYSTGGGSDLTFIHRTFAEYFSATRLAGLVEKPEDDQKHKLACDFLCKYIFKEKNIISDFFNYMLAKNLPVHYAAFVGKLETIKDAVCIDTKDLIGRTPLCYAISNYQLGPVTLLLQKNTEVDISNIFLRRAVGTFLPKLARHERFEVIEMLVRKMDTSCLSQEEKGLLLGQKFGNMTTIQYAYRCFTYGSVVVRLLTNEGVDITSRYRDEQTALELVKRFCLDKDVRCLIQNGAILNYIDSTVNCAPLCSAVSTSTSLDIVKFLIEKTDANFINNAGVKGFPHLSIILRQVRNCADLSLEKIIDLFETLIRMGVNLNVRDKNGATPLCVAIFERKEAASSRAKIALFNVGKLLLERGAIYDRRTTKYKCTPLELCGSSDLADDMYQMLSCIDKLFVAVQRSHHFITSLLETARENNIMRAVVNARNRLGYSVFEFACELSYPDSQSFSIKSLLSEAAKNDIDLDYLSGVSEIFCSQPGL